MNSMLPRPIERGSAIETHCTSCASFPSRASPVASERMRTPGSAHGLSGGGGGVGETSFDAAPSPFAFTAAGVYAYLSAAPALVFAVGHPRAPTRAPRGGRELSGVGG